MAGLTATRYRGPATSREAHEGLNLWIGRFASACKRAVDDARSFESRARALEGRWRGRLGRVRAHSSTDLLLPVLIGAPVLTVNTASELIQRSFVQTNEAAIRLVEAGILRQVTVGRRNRAFEAPEVISAFTDLERRLATPGGDNPQIPTRPGASHVDRRFRTLKPALRPWRCRHLAGRVPPRPQTRRRAETRCRWRRRSHRYH